MDIIQKDILETTKLLANFLNLKKINNNHIFQVIMNKQTGRLQRLTVNMDNITTLHIFRDDKKFVANKIEKVLYKKNFTKRRYYKIELI